MASARRTVPSHAIRSYGKENTLKLKNPINAILDALAAQQRQGETSLTVKIAPDLIQDAMNVPGLQKVSRSRESRSD